MSDARIAVVTGCCGRIGRAVANELAAERWHVRGFDRSERPKGLDADVEYQQGDLEDTVALTAILSGATAVVHLAACADDADFFSALLPCNIIGVVNVLEACRAEGIQRVVVASSGKVHYAHKGGLPIRVTDEVSVVCNYGATKLFAEGAAQAFASSTGARTTVIRFAWCPRTPEDIAAMRAATACGHGADEFLSPADAATCVAAALRAEAEGFAIVFCQSLPPPGRTARFDLAPAMQRLGWRARDTFPANIEQLCAADYTANPDLFSRRRPQVDD